AAKAGGRSVAAAPHPHGVESGVPTRTLSPMVAPRRASLSTPRRLVVGLIVFGSVVACHRNDEEEIVPAPVRAPTPAPRGTPPAPKPAPAAPESVAIANAPMLLRAMHERYDGKWYRTVTFVQKTTIGLPSGGTVNQTWYEAGELPGRLRIDTDVSARTGVLYAR